MKKLILIIPLFALLGCKNKVMEKRFERESFLSKNKSECTCEKKSEKPAVIIPPVVQDAEITQSEGSQEVKGWLW